MENALDGGGLDYVCENDDCWKKGVIQEVPRGREAECPYCGWYMTSSP